MLTLLPDEQHREDYRNGGRFCAGVHQACSMIDELSRYSNRCDINMSSRLAEFPDICGDETGHLGSGYWPEGADLSVGKIREAARDYGFDVEITASSR
jgi:hypothetical protein